MQIAPAMAARLSTIVLRTFAAGTVLGLMGCVTAGCYSSGNGTAPPGSLFYFPVGLAVSRGGNVLYAVNSDFDLQYNGGTLQSYDLHAIRRDTVRTIADPTDPNIPWLRPPPAPGACPGNPPVQETNGTPTRQPLGETCAPPADSQFYVRDSAIIGAFATDLQISSRGDRLFAPVRGDASLTWADVVPDDPTQAPPANSREDYEPFHIDCGARASNRCDTAHRTGNDPNAPGNFRHVTMPGEPWGMAQSEDGTVIAITHQTDTKTSLLTTGLPSPGSDAPESPPTLQSVLDGLPIGGSGIAAVPHDPLAFPDCGAGDGVCPPRPAFLQTNRAVPELDLLRVYPDQGYAGSPAVLVKETAFSLTVSASGTDSRSMVIDTTPRRACELALLDAGNATSDTLEECARRPARVFIASRSPDALLLGEIGEPSPNGDGTYDPDRLVLSRSLPLPIGASRVYLAPIVDADGRYALRVFVVDFDSATVAVFDPDAEQVEVVMGVAQGPYAMAFDPFSWDDVARRAPAGVDPREPSALKAYRFAYVASFTNSFVQVIDLDGSRADKSTFERVVFTLGQPTIPKGQQTTQ